jgi:hypothetical protein
MKNFILLLPILITGCMTPEARREQQIVHCTELGFKPGTEAFGNCRLQLESMQVSRSAAAAALINANNANRPRTCNTFGNQTSCY